MDYRTVKRSLLEWGRGYVHRLNTGGRQPALPGEEQAGLCREPKDRPFVNLILFAVTFVTMTLAGMSMSEADTARELLFSGISYSLTLMCILLCHEFGHYFAARKFGVNPTLPFFIPLPLPFPSPGTMGAVIKTRSPIPDRRALLYIGALGPLPGFIVSLAASAIGIYISDVRPLPASGGDLIIFGDSMLFVILIKLFHGAIPAGHDLFLSPCAWAGWIGFLITSLNLMPIGQLDGSHILYSLIGRKQLFFGWGAFAGLAILAFVWQGWIIWVVLTLVLLMVAHPEVPEHEKLTTAEKAMGWFCMVVLILTFVPVPVDFL